MKIKVNSVYVVCNSYSKGVYGHQDATHSRVPIFTVSDAYLHSRMPILTVSDAYFHSGMPIFTVNIGIGMPIFT